jgi:hypothetical protein
MIQILWGIPEHLEHLIYSGKPAKNDIHTHTSVSASDVNNVSVIERYTLMCDHLFMLGRIEALNEISCVGNITIVCREGISRVTGSINVATEEVGEIIDGLGEVLETAAQRFIENHPKASLFISCEIAPRGFFTIPEKLLPPHSS